MKLVYGDKDCSLDLDISFWMPCISGFIREGKGSGGVPTVLRSQMRMKNDVMKHHIYTQMK